MYIIIVGCGRLGSELAKMLSDEGHDIVVIDTNQKSFQRLGHAFNGLAISGNGFNCEILEEAGIRQAQAVAAVTDDDNINIITVQIAKQIYNIPLTIARVYDPKKAETYKRLGLDIVSTTTVISRMFRDRIYEGRLEKYLKAQSDTIDIFKIEIKRNMIGRKVKEYSHPGLFIPVTITSKGKMILPKPDDILLKGDILMGIGLADEKDRIYKLLEGGN